MLNDKLYSEIFDEFKTAKTDDERVAVLRKYDHPRFRSFLQATFHPSIIFDVDIPKYRPAVEPAGLNYTYLGTEMSKMYRFVKNHPAIPPGLTQEKKKSLLVVVLESLHKDEADLVVKMMNKDLKIEHLTIDIVKKAFPNLINVVN
jgi:hypothetical protein